MHFFDETKGFCSKIKVADCSFTGKVIFVVYIWFFAHNKLLRRRLRLRHGRGRKFEENGKNGAVQMHNAVWIN